MGITIKPTKMRIGDYYGYDLGILKEIYKAITTGHDYLSAISFKVGAHSPTVKKYLYFMVKRAYILKKSSSRYMNREVYVINPRNDVLERL